MLFFFFSFFFVFVLSTVCQNKLTDCSDRVLFSTESKKYWAQLELATGVFVLFCFVLPAFSFQLQTTVCCQNSKSIIQSIPRNTTLSTYAPTSGHRSNWTASRFSLFHSAGRFGQVPGVPCAMGMAPLRLCAFGVWHGAAIGAIIPVVRQHHPSLPLALLAQGQIEAHLLARRCTAAGDRAASWSPSPFSGWFLFIFYFFKKDWAERARGGEMSSMIVGFIYWFVFLIHFKYCFFYFLLHHGVYALKRSDGFCTKCLSASSSKPRRIKLWKWCCKSQSFTCK